MIKSLFSPKSLSKFGNFVLKYRYVICTGVVIIIFLIGLIMFFGCGWGGKDVVQICTGLLLTITLFFTALNYEFATIKTKNDYKTAKDILTFNTANEWHKAPIKDYQRISIEFENKFIKSNTNRSVTDFDAYIESELEFRESLKGILNYFENMSIGVHKGLIDKLFIYEFISFIFEIYYIDYYYYIEHCRKKRGNNTIWENFTKLAEEWWPNLKEEIRNGTKRSSIITEQLKKKA